MARGTPLEEQKARVRAEEAGLLWTAVCDWAQRAQKDRLRKLLAADDSNVAHRLRGEIRILALIPALGDTVIQELEQAAKQGGGT